MVDRGSMIGSRPVRFDGPEKVTGKANYGADFVLPGMLFGAVRRSEHAHARILSIDTSEAAALVGVSAIVTAADFPDLNFGGIGDLARDNLAKEKVLYHGHAVAAVAATTSAVARQAAGLIRVEYEVLKPVLTLAEALTADAPLLHDHLSIENEEGETKPSNAYQRDVQSFGDVEAGFDQADVVIEREFTTPTVHQGYIEPPVCVASFVEGGLSTLWSTTQGHFPLRDTVVRVMGMSQADLRVIPAEVGGAFGGKTAMYQEAMAMMLSRRSGRPVRMNMTREEVFRCAGPGAGTHSRIRIGARSDGTITAMAAWLTYESGAFPAAPTGGGMRSVFSGYDVANIYVEGLSVVLNKPKVRAYRGPGAPQATFGSESVLNEIAETLNMDPIELRIRNAAREGSTTAAGTFRQIGFVECLEAARESDHYRSPLPEGQGRAVAAGFWRNGAGVSSAAVHMNSDGSASVVSGSADLSGTRMSLAMMASAELGLPLSQISSTVGDTESVGFTGTSGGSRTINATGQAVVEASRDAVLQMKQRAASGWNVTTEQIEWQDGEARNRLNGEKLTAKEICRAAPATGGPITGNYALNGTPGLGPGFAVHICDVSVDRETGKVTLERYTAVQDAGRAIHPDAVEGQMQGGAVQGIGWALNEEYCYNDDGVLDNAGFLDYRIPLASDLPMIDTIVVEVPNDMHPYGVRGVGEAPIIPPLAAVASAVSQAIGTRITELPCSPPKILAKLMSQ